MTAGIFIIRMMMKKKKQDGNSVSGILDQVSAQNTGNRAAGANHGDQRVRIENDLQQSRAYPRDQIENKITLMSDSIFNIIAKDPQIQHIARKMHDSAMYKHGSKNF